MGAPYPILQNGMGSPQGIWDISTTKNHDIGTRAALPDGRVYYYGRYSAASAIGPGKLLVAATTAGHADMLLGAKAIGTTVLSYTSGSGTASANDFADGYCIVNDDTGEGVTYKIASHPAIAATTTSSITLVDGLYLASGAATTITLVKNPWCDPVISVTDQADFPVGVSNVEVPIGSTTAQYFWCQTWGVAAVWADEATGQGSLVTTGTGVAGQTEAQDGAGEALVGTQMVAATDTEYYPVFLQIAP